MKFVTPEISWHGRDPLYSVDFQCGRHDITRFATCGTDQFVRIWELTRDPDSKPGVKILANLQRHTRTVNVVRFSPDGSLLASASDDSVVILWKLNPLSPEANLFKEEDQEDNVENWTVQKNLRSHLEGIYDLSWSRCGKFLLSCSIDKTTVLWDAVKGAKIKIFSEAKHFVQGVAYDPMGIFFATMSVDRTCRIYSLKSKSCCNVISKQTPQLTNESNSEEKPKAVRMFYDESLKGFFRRLTFSPDGQLLITPAGCIENNGSDEATNTTYVFSRHMFTKPVAHMPGPPKATLAVRCSPILYDLRSDCDVKAFDLPYRMIFAVATDDSVLLYDTQQLVPISYLSNIHYHTLSDLSWSSDGQVLIVSSTDGFCTIISFEVNELGTPYEKQVGAILEPCESPVVVDTAPVETADIAPVETPAKTVECQKNSDLLMEGLNSKPPKTLDKDEKEETLTQPTESKALSNSSSAANVKTKTPRRINTTLVSQVPLSSNSHFK